MAPVAFEAERGVNAVREGLGGTSSSQPVAVGVAVGPAARLLNPEPLQPTGMPPLLLALNPLHLQMNQEPLPPKMLLLSRTRNETQLRTENVNTHTPQPEKPTQHRGEPSHQTDFFNFFHHLAFERN